MVDFCKVSIISEYLIRDKQIRRKSSRICVKLLLHSTNSSQIFARFHQLSLLDWLYSILQIYSFIYSVSTHTFSITIIVSHNDPHLWLHCRVYECRSFQYDNTRENTNFRYQCSIVRQIIVDLLRYHLKKKK